MNTEKRIIPILSIDNNRLVKTFRFKNPQYIGDPINALKIFNTKMVDELAVIDISRQRKKRGINFDFLSKFIGEAFMPIAYGGGIKNIDQVKKLFSIGYDRVILNSITFDNQSIIKEAANLFGTQAVIVSLDFKKSLFGNYNIFSNSGKVKERLNLEDFLGFIKDSGAGEILVNSIYNDGTFNGYDLDLTRKVSSLTKIPIIACGGARGTEDFESAINLADASAVAASSCFIFKKQSRESILISYKA